ncbi:hypothetical protein LCGC14_2950760 [marine sediment metagenome]|uniref:Uncharacterized protein n=1 Tax=marine sediment metagenome TaxID=412755 RepID=A0A0F8ZMY5_9ZZZZ
MDYTKITLGEALSSPNPVIVRNALSMLKQYQRCNHDTQNKSTLPTGENHHYCVKCGLVLSDK